MMFNCVKSYIMMSLMKGGQNARNALEQKKITSFIVHNESPYFICVRIGAKIPNNNGLKFPTNNR